MAWRRESHVEEGWWSSVMTELDAIDAHTKAGSHLPHAHGPTHAARDPRAI